MSKLVENYLLQEAIGKGVYGQVHRALHQKTKKEYAVKAIPKSSFKTNPKLEQLAINEINILSTLKHPNIVRFIETLKTPNNFYFVYEYCNGGTLESMLHTKKQLPEAQALILFRQLLEAFKELNKNNIMHRDLKPDNIFFSDGQVKLGDFGFCKMLEVNMAQTMLGSPIYMAPQILKEEIYTLKADIWSLGVVLFEMLFGFCPYQSSSISQLINVIKDTELVIPKDVNPISEECEALIRKMLVKDQFKRIEWVDLFDYRIDIDGRILSGNKKDLGIEALEKYFLFDVKPGDNIDYSKKTDSQHGYPLKDGLESNKLINSNRDISTPINGVEPPSLKKTVSEQPTLSSAKENNRTDSSEGLEFVERHGRWVRGVKLLQELGDLNEDWCESLFGLLMGGMVKQVSQQYQMHPEWTDVLMQEKRALADSLRKMGKDETQCSPEHNKAHLLSVWRKADDRSKPMMSRLIRYLYNAEGTPVQIDSLLVV